MRHHAMRFGWVAALAFGLADAGLAQTLTAALNFGSTTLNLTGSGGYYWQSFRSTSTVIANLTATDGTSPTGLRFECLNAAGFENAGRGGQPVLYAGGHTFPGGSGGIQDSYVADNTSSGRDALMAFSIQSDTQYTLRLSFSSSYAYDSTAGAGKYVTQFNVGGTWNSGTKTFTGGTTVALDSAVGSGEERGQAGSIADIEMAWNDVASKYEAILLVGTGGTTAGAYINGLVVDAVLGALNEAPVAMFTQDAATAGDAPVWVTFDATDSYDPESAPLEFRWSFGDGNATTSTAAVVSNYYVLPGPYSVTLIVSDGDMAGATNASVRVTGNRAPATAIRAHFAGYVGQTSELDGSGSSDPDEEDTLTYAWSQVAGPSVALSGSTSSLCSFGPSQAGDYQFRLVVTDDGTPPLSATGTVGVAVYAPTAANVQIDFGSAGSTSLPGPGHAAFGGPLKDTDLAWNGVGAADNATVPDPAFLLTAANGSPTVVSLDLGRNSSTLPDYGKDPRNRSGDPTGSDGSVGVFANTLFKDFISAGNDGDTGNTWVQCRVRGLAPARYDVYAVVRNTFYSGTETFAFTVRSGAGDAMTDFGALAGQPVLQDLAQYAAQSTTWIANTNFVHAVVDLTPASPDLLVAVHCASGNQRGVLNALQVVERKPNGTMLLIR